MTIDTLGKNFQLMISMASEVGLSYEAITFKHITYFLCIAHHTNLRMFALGCWLRPSYIFLSVRRAML